MGRGDGIPLSPQGTTMRAKGGSFPRSTFGSPCTHEATYVPLAMLPKLRDSADPGPRVRVESARDFYNLPDAALAGTRRLESDPHRRLHSSPIRTLVKRDLDSGLIPDHLLSGEQPDVGHKVSSLDFFKPSKNERPRTVPGPMNYAHEYRVHKKPDAAALSQYKAGASPERAQTPLRVVSHTFKGVAKPKRNPDVNPRGISRNIMGGFYTN